MIVAAVWLNSAQTFALVVQHVGGLQRRDGPDVVPHGLGPEEAGEGVSHDQQ